MASQGKLSITSRITVRKQPDHTAALQHAYRHAYPVVLRQPYQTGYMHQRCRRRAHDHGKWKEHRAPVNAQRSQQRRGLSYFRPHSIRPVRPMHQTCGHGRFGVHVHNVWQFLLQYLRHHIPHAGFKNLRTLRHLDTCQRHATTSDIEHQRRAIYHPHSSIRTFFARDRNRPTPRIENRHVLTEYARQHQSESIRILRFGQPSVQIIGQYVKLCTIQESPTHNRGINRLTQVHERTPHPHSDHGKTPGIRLPHHGCRHFPNTLNQLDRDTTDPCVNQRIHVFHDFIVIHMREQRTPFNDQQFASG